jgi:hypothetical protein
MGDIELGASRGTVLQRLRDADIDYDADDGAPAHVELPDMDVELTFERGPVGTLIQIAVQDDRVQFGTRHVLRCRLHEITELLDVREGETVWRMDEDPNLSLLPDRPTTQGPVSDRELLESGTLWVQPLGLGLRLWRGVLYEIYLRRPEHVPAEGAGRLTADQLALSRREDLDRVFETPRPPEHGLRRLIRIVASGLLFAALGGIIWQAAEFQRQWHAAPTAQAKIVAVNPDSPDTIPTEFIVAYQDQQGGEHQAALGLADIYVPKQVGETVELKYLPDEPDRPLGPGRVSDAAFVKFFPWAIAAFALYLVVLLVEAVFWKLAKKPAALQT